MSDITNYLVASEDEIRLLNQPQGYFQIRGLKIEEMIAILHNNPSIDTRSLGRQLVDSHYDSYQKAVPLWADHPESELVKYAGSMALVDCDRLPDLVHNLDLLAQRLIGHAQDPAFITAVGRALYSSQQFASFLNLEYYDLADFIRNLVCNANKQDIRSAGAEILQQMQQQVILYERHTHDRHAEGLSIYLSNPLVPQNIFEAHQAMYRTCRFSAATQWDEWIDLFRLRWKANGAGLP